MSHNADKVCYCSECNTSIDCKAIADRCITYSDYLIAMKAARDELPPSPYLVDVDW